MALAESTHHSAQRQKTAMAGREARDALHGHVPEAPLSQSRVLRHVVGHLSVPALYVPVPQRVAISCRTLSSSFVCSHLILSRLSKYPRSCLSMSPMRAAVRVPKLAEQLVEVPTIISFSSLQRTVEQHVDTPVPGGGGTSFWSSRFFLWTEFNSDAVLLSGLWSKSLSLVQVDGRPSWFSPRTMFIFFSLSSWC